MVISRSMIRGLALMALFSAYGFATPVTINFSSSLLTTLGGNPITFLASLTNTSATSVFLNSDSLNVAAPLTADDVKFFLNFPLSIGPGTTPIAQIFDIIVPANTPPGIYAGHFSILGGNSSRDLNPVATANFAVNVVPEPATVSLWLAGLFGLGLAYARKLRLRE